MLVLASGHCFGDAAKQDAAESEGQIRYQVVVITDDDFLLPDRPAWCHRELARAVDEVRKVRSEAELQLTMQFAGEPVFLTDNKTKLGPRRAICFICDADNRVLGFCVGVPAGRYFTGLLEDADQTQLLRVVGSLQEPKPDAAEIHQRDKVAEAIHQRSMRRVSQHYHTDLSRIDRQTSIGVATTLLLPALNADRADRFNVSDISDRLRCTSLQQHPETMRHWCEAILPSIVGKNIQSVWPELATAIWDAQPWQIPTDDSDLITWYDSSIKAGPVVLSVFDETNMLGLPQTLADNRAALHDAATKEVGSLEMHVSHRQIGIAALAHLMQHRNDRPPKILKNVAGNSIWAVIPNTQSPTELVFARSTDRLAQIVRKLTRIR